MIRLTRYKLIAFIISAAIAGLAGATKSIAYQFAVLDDIGFQMSGLIVLMTLLGGAGTIFGPLVGATIVVALESLLATSPFPSLHPVRPDVSPAELLAKSSRACRDDRARTDGRRAGKTRQILGVV
jgi:ABC-type branched-subunit amino acid transport system permease subunit